MDRRTNPLFALDGLSNYALYCSVIARHDYLWASYI